MKAFLKFVVVVLALGGTAAVTPSEVLAQCAKCDAGQPDGCAYGPFADKKGQCTFVVGVCYAVGECGGETEEFAADQADFSLDGLLNTSPRTVAGADFSLDGMAVSARIVTGKAEPSWSVALEGRSVLRHCSGLIASITD